MVTYVVNHAVNTTPVHTMYFNTYATAMDYLHKIETTWKGLITRDVPSDKDMTPTTKYICYTGDYPDNRKNNHHEFSISKNVVSDDVLLSLLRQ
jgi:hypothetical protein